MMSSTSQAEITAAYANYTNQVVGWYWQLADDLVAKYADGIDGTSYSDWWLLAVGYKNGPPPV